MAYDPIDPSAITSGGTISKTAFGDKVRTNFADHETRLETVESAVSGVTANVNGVFVTGGRRWYSGSATLIGASQAAGVPVIHPFDQVETTESGYTYSGGVFTITSDGVYDFVANLCGVVGSDTGFYVQSFISKVSGGAPSGVRWGYDSVGIGTQSQRVFSNPQAKNVTIAAGDTVACFLCFDVGAGVNKTYTPAAAAAPVGLTITATHPSNFAIQRIR